MQLEDASASELARELHPEEIAACADSSTATLFQEIAWVL